MSELLYIGFDGGGSNSRYIIQHGDAEPGVFAYEESIKYSDRGHEVVTKQVVERISQHISEP